MKARPATLTLMLLVSGRASAAPLSVQDLPVPPEQHRAWNPAGVPSNILSAAVAVFQQGFPDPRGCEFSEIEIEASGVWAGQPSRITTFGWAIPMPAGQTQQFAICWNGCIYPAKRIGQRSDLHAQAGGLPPLPAPRFNSAVAETASVFSTNSLSQRALLLLRDGETEAALKTWTPNAQLVTEFQAAMLQASASRALPYDPYLEFAGDWTWALFDHTLAAHMRGDVPVALASARKLAEIQPRIESEAARRGFPRQTYYDSAREGQPKPYLDFLEQLPRLLADLERRAREPKAKSVIEVGLDKIADRSQRIVALIQDLDLVQVRQWGQPGGVNLAEDPIVGALIDEGDAAVEPLIDCLEKDKRLTRSVGFSRDFHRHRVVLPVSSAARAALQNILRIEARSVAEFRGYWNENKGLKLEERWYAILKNDAAGYGQWLQASRCILQPENVSGVPGAPFSSEMPLKPGEKPKFRGEVLRLKASPSLSELLLKRATAAAEEARKKDQSMGVDSIRTGCELVETLAQWDKPSAALAPARLLMRRSIELWPNSTTFTMSSGHDLARSIPQLTQIRVSGGDTNAIQEYVEWIRSVTEEKADTYALQAFEPLWKNSEHPAIVSISEWLFNDPASPWSKLPWRRSSFDDPVESELVKVAGFRRLLSRELDKEESVGSMEYFATNAVRFEIPARASGGRQILFPRADQPAIGTKVEVRSCDWIAWTLSTAKRIPFFNPFVPIGQRNEAIRNAKKLLQTQEW